MGTVQHHALIVTDNDRIEEAYAYAASIGCQVSALSDPVSNGYRSFVVWPDGSKEGWEPSILGDDRRENLTAWCSAHYIAWAEIGYGELGTSLRSSAHEDTLYSPA